MRAKILVSILSLFLVFNLCSLTSAAWVSDPAGDTLLPGYDISQTNLELWQPTPGTWYMKASLDMAAGDKTPGIVVLELDVDGDSATGGNFSMAGILTTCLAPPLVKVEAGFDIALILANRDQSGTSTSAYCSGCGICPNAGETNDTCTSPLDPCGESRKQGEWWASASVAGGTNAGSFERGRIDLPLPPAADTPDGDGCYAFDYSRLIQSAYDYIDPTNTKRFNLAKAQDPGTYLKYQVSVWHSTTWGVDGEDFIDAAGPCRHTVDVCPDAGKAAAEIKPADCTANLNNSGPSAGKVGIFDLLIMKTQYGWGTSGNPGCFMGNCK